MTRKRNQAHAEGRMRFLHAGPDDARDREVLAARIDAVLAQLTPSNAAALVAELHPHLDAEVLRDGLVVVSPRGERQLRPLAAFVVERAARLEGLRLVTHRPPQTFGDMREAVLAEHGFDLASAQARAGFSRGHLLELVIYGDGFGGHTDACALAAAERAAEVLLGERVLDDWIGKIDAEPLPRGGPLRVVQQGAAPRFALSELAQTISGAVEGLVGSLPDLASLSGSRDGWVLFEAEPEAATDYRAQDDVALASSALPELLKCFLEGAPFSSRRFVRGGAQVVYLKLDARGTPFERRVVQRAKLEDELGAALSARRLGAVIGNGLGLRYAYVTLALSPGSEALALVCDVARRADVSRRSWVHFCDSDLGREWLGVWPDSPPPP